MHADDLWPAIRKDNEKAFKEAFYLYYPGAVALASRFIQDQSMAKDLAQDVFFKLWDKRSSIQIRKDLKAYINQSIRNACLNHLKKHKRLLAWEDHYEVEDHSPDMLAILKSQDLQKVVDQAINTMPAACRTVFLLRRMEGLSIKEIAKHLNISPKTVENQITKAGKILTKRIFGNTPAWIIIMLFLFRWIGAPTEINVF